jgi:hypothetical protein
MVFLFQDHSHALDFGLSLQYGIKAKGLERKGLNISKLRKRKKKRTCHKKNHGRNK